MGIVQRRTFVRKYSTISTRVIVGLFLIDEKPTSFVDKRTKDRHTLESSQGGSRLVTDLAMLITRPMSWPKYLLPNMNDVATSDVRSAQGGSR